jgi:hypothetical protein
VFAGSTPIGNGLTGGFGGLWGTPVALVMNGVVVLVAEAAAAVAVLRGGIRVGGGPGRGRTAPVLQPEPVQAGTSASLPSVD